MSKEEKKDPIDILKKINYTEKNLDIDLFPDFFSDETANIILKKILKLPEVKGKVEKKRKSLLFGNTEKNKHYVINYKGTEIKKQLLNWEKYKIIKNLKEYVESTLSIEFGFRVEFDVCVLQIYKDGSVGINPHRDKEVGNESLICGLSLGATRDLVMGITSKIKGELVKKDITIPLKTGSLYVFHPPTNLTSTHSISKNGKIKDMRISLTFRDYVQPFSTR